MSSPAMTVSKDMLFEIVKRLQRPADVIRCAAVCRRWRGVISSRGSSLPAPPGEFGFFYNHRCLPWFVPTKAGVDLSLDLDRTINTKHAVVEDCRGGRLLLREFFWWKELTLIVHHPLERSTVRLPPLMTDPAKSVAFIALVPADPGFRVAVVLFDEPFCGTHFHILVYHSAIDSWVCAEGGLLEQKLGKTVEQSIVVGDVAYKLQHDEKLIVAVNTADMMLFLVPLPADAGTNMYRGNRCIGKTADGRLCFFELDDSLRLVQWVLQGAGTWAPEKTQVALRPLMSPSTVGDLHDMELSVRDWLRRNYVGLRGFCEGSGTLFFIMADKVVTLDLKTLDMEVLWTKTDRMILLFEVFPYEMMAWPPVPKDFAKSTMLN